jgi:hypothetical protein
MNESRSREAGLAQVWSRLLEAHHNRETVAVRDFNEEYRGYVQQLSSGGLPGSVVTVVASEETNGMVLRGRFITLPRCARRVPSCPVLARSVGLGPVCSPPFARTLRLSTLARDQSIVASLPRQLSSVTCSRRQQVVPLPHPSSIGNNRQGHPVLRTKTRPARAT